MTTLTVSQVNRYIKSILDENEPLRRVYVVGEISNFKHHIPSGHMYFTLKDSSSQLKCVMFSYSNTHLKFKPEDGMSVICFGNISAFEREGTYQLYVTSMQPNGVGSLSVAFEQLKDKLDKKGYFRQENKKPIPKYPNRIGVITSNSGAAVEDIKMLFQGGIRLPRLILYQLRFRVPILLMISPYLSLLRTGLILMC